MFFFFFFQAEDGIRDRDVTEVQTCALPITSIASLLSTAWRWTLRKSENLLCVLSATSGGYNSLCFPASQPYSYAGSASTRVRRLLSPTRLHKRYDISSSFSSFVVTPKGP